jgi:TRAP-type transport system periplasmic protein
MGGKQMTSPFSFRILGAALAVAAAVLAGQPGPAAAQEVTLRIHHFLPPQAPVPANFIAPWAEKVEQESAGRIKVEIYPTM